MSDCSVAGEKLVILLLVVMMASLSSPTPTFLGFFDAGRIRHNFTAYYESLTQSAAVSKCEEYGGRLAIVSYNIQMLFNSSTSSKLIDGSSFWIGAKMKTLEEWQWLNGQKISSSKNYDFC